MPSVSKKQHAFMEMVAHDPAAAKRVGVPQSVGEDFAAADKGKEIKELPQHVRPRLAKMLMGKK
jgi:hypothetical protein